MTRAPTCWKHPAHSQIGVCAVCLRDRLKQLCLEEQYSSPRCSFDCSSGAPASAAAAPVAGLGENVAALLAADHHRNNADESLPKFASFLQRTHSWSGSRHQQQQGGKDLGKSKNPGLQLLPPSGALVCDEDFPSKGHCKASSWPEIESPKTEKMGSWIASLFGFRRKESKEPKDSRRKFFGLVRKKKSSTAASTVAGEEDVNQQLASSSPWRFKGEFDEFRSSKVMPFGGEFMSTEQQQPSLGKVRSVNGRKNPLKGDMPVGSSWSTPFRRTIQNREMKNEEDQQPVTDAEVKRFHPSPATFLQTSNCSSYTAYYRDSWSLHSSPMPGKPIRNHHQSFLHHQQQLQQQARRDHLHPSPFHHATGSNTWNFYLTPLRPVRSSAGARRV